MKIANVAKIVMKNAGWVRINMGRFGHIIDQTISDGAITDDYCKDKGVNYHDIVCTAVELNVGIADVVNMLKEDFLSIDYVKKCSQKEREQREKRTKDLLGG